MLFKNSLKVTVNNINLIFKVLIYVFLLLLICMALFYAIIEPILNDLFYEFDFANELQKTVTDWLEGNNSSFKGFITDLSEFFNHRSQNLITSLVFFMLLYALLVLSIGVTMVPITEVVYAKLREGVNVKFLHSFVKNLKSSFLYAVLNMVITCVIDYALMALGVFLGSFFYSIFGYLGITMTIASLLLLFSIKLTVFIEWLPQIVCRKKGIIDGLKDNFKNIKINLMSSFVPILAMVISMFVILISTSLFTFAISLAVAVPTYLVILNAIGVLTHLDNVSENYQL